ncbi:MAG TPA: M6 family metalloprotease domain-containing protein [Gemmatimonadales bacterium]|nr:M6 family metalloprotease domain-containing protein [Gemmatimonadales bacterium]
MKATRSQLVAGAQFSLLNSRSAMGTASVTTVSGVLEVPAILFRYKDSPAPLFTAANYNDVLFGATPTGAAAGRPYTYRSFYTQMSNGAFDIQGTTYNYIPLDSNEVWYAGGTSASCAQQNPFGSQNCNGLFSSTAITRMQNGLREALDSIDKVVDFSPYITSAADNGFVPLVLFIHQAMGGECGPGGSPENHLWAHRFTIGTYSTQDNDPFHAGQKVKISDYILQSGLGGPTSCSTTQIMPIGTVAHETGHSFGLPDLYDTDGTSEGVGQWDLMSSGSFTSALSPARMGAWSLNELGWITLAPATTTGTRTFDAAPLSDTAFYVRVQGSNPRGEYYLLENRQRQESDTALIRIHCARAGSPGCPGGLLAWHIDSLRLAQSFSNDINTGSIHGVAVVQADAFGNLDAAPVQGNFCPSSSMFSGCSNRGDAGDLFPGTTSNTRGLVFLTNPAALKNADGSFAGFAVDSIQQLVANRTLSFRLRFGALTLVRASDPAATIQFNGSSYTEYRDLLEEGQGYPVNITDPQLSANGRTRFHFGSWSDGGAQSHSYIGHLAGDTLTAMLTRDFKLTVTASTGGTIQADTGGVDITSAVAAGAFIREGRSVTLTATPTPPETFGGWSGDTVTTNPTVVLPMGRSYSIFASFGSLAISSATARPNGVMGAAYNDTLRVSGGTGSNSWSVTSGALPLGVTLDAASGVVSGFPRQTGNFTYTASVTSGAQTQQKAFTFSVSAPTLATSDVLVTLFGGSALSADQQRYLDFLGNNNSGFDIGDFLAWVKLTGAPLSPAMVETLQNLPRRKGGPQ